MVRIYFKEEKVRKKFFIDVLINSGFKTWKELRNSLKISKSALENYKNGKLTIPGDFYKNIIAFLPQKLKEDYNAKIYSKKDNWGAIKGGKKNYEKNKWIFEMGRKKALKSIRKIHQISDAEINKNFELDFYEVIGAFIGDGFLNKYGNSYIIQFAGDSRYDFCYYKNKIIPVISRLFDRKPFIRTKGNCMWITFHSKQLFYVLIKRFHMPKGKKVYTVKIPEEILKDKNKLIYTLRGIFDTDGCIFVDKRKTYKKLYPRIALQLTNKPIIEQIHLALSSLNIKCGISEKTRGNAYTIQINGFKEVKKYINIIGFSNKRHLDRIKNFL